MVRLHRRLFRSPYFLIFITSIIYLYILRFVLGENSEVEIDQWLITSHIITIIVNNAFLLFQAKKVGVLRNIRDMSMLRIGKDQFCVELFILSFKGLLMYFILTYGVLTIICFNTLSIIPVYVFFMMLNVVIFFVYEILFNFMILNEDNSIYIIIPFIFNMVFHYVIQPMLFYT